MDRRFVLFLVCSFAILFVHAALTRRLNPPPPQPPAKAPQAARPGEKQAGGKEQPEQKGEQPRPPQPPEEQPHKPPKPPQPEVPQEFDRRWGTLGSGNMDAPYRMLVTWDNRGAAIARIELNSDRYHDLEDRSGYLGHLVTDKDAIDKDSRGKGCAVQVVGPGTPAAEAGLKVGDLITELRGKDVSEKIGGVDDLREALKKTKPRKNVTLTVQRDGHERTLEVTLGRRPLEVIRPERETQPEADSPPSFLLTLQHVEGQGIDKQVLSPEDDESLQPGSELKGITLWSGNWEVEEADPSRVVFRRLLSDLGLEVTKTYRLEKVPAGAIQSADYKAYHLVLDVKIRNVAEHDRKVAYQLDGPNGLPAEGVWYAYKIARKWFQAVGLRDVVVSFNGGTPTLIGCPKIAEDKVDGLPWQTQPLSYIGVDAQYFSCVLIPQKEDRSVRLPPTEAAPGMWFAQSRPLRLGEVDKNLRRMANTSCRLVSQPYDLSPGGKPNDTLSHRFVVFAGPKKPDLLAQYDGLGELVYYGWFGAIAKPMSAILHFFYAIVRNYGLAILMLTILVRGCMFPLSRKQALGAQKMQELQPEIKRLSEKYKNDVEGRTKAQQELFRKHNYNPLSGCLVLFFQLPIFVALYRSLMVDIELRQAPLLGNGIRWCSNLSAPDMLYDWSGFWTSVGWESFNSGRGILSLGPFFNLLPILTIVLFIAQQKMFMPPATDDKTAMQQKMMKFMMIFMGVMFFKVASGLCIYFIASSLWGLAERKFLPKPAPKNDDAKPATRADAKAREKAQAKPTKPTKPAKPAKPASPPAADGRDGEAARRKKKAKRGRR